MISPNTKGFSGVITLIGVTLIGVICNPGGEIYMPTLNCNPLSLFRTFFGYSPAAPFHDFSREFVLIDGNPDKILIFWTNHIRIPNWSEILPVFAVPPTN